MNAIHIANLSKVYRLYRHHADRLKESLHPLRKKYHEDYYALNDVSLDIEQGETIGIIGRNGSGKSTLLKVMAGILTPSGGEVAVNGKVAALLELGAGFNPELTGIENIYFSGIIMGFSKTEMDERLDGVIAFADIGEFIHQPVKTYSSGMFVRLAFAVAISVDPDILIIDEALAVGDLSFQAKCFKRLNDFRTQGKTVIIVTHALDSVIRYCHKAIVLDSGRKVIEADPKTAVDAYKKLMAKCEPDATGPARCAGEDGSAAVGSASGAMSNLKDQFAVDPNALSYGNGMAEIADFGMFDDAARPAQLFHKGRPFTIRMKVVFKADIESPVFAFTIKDLKGLDITGTNTHYKKVSTGSFMKGNEALVEFSQCLNCQSGQYSLSLGCTGIAGDQLDVYHRLYDVLLFEAISEEPMVGFFDLGSRIAIERGGSISAAPMGMVPRDEST